MDKYLHFFKRFLFVGIFAVLGAYNGYGQCLEDNDADFERPANSTLYTAGTPPGGYSGAYHITGNEDLTIYLNDWNNNAVLYIEGTGTYTLTGNPRATTVYVHESATVLLNVSDAGNLQLYNRGTITRTTKLGLTTYARFMNGKTGYISVPAIEPIDGWLTNYGIIEVSDNFYVNDRGVVCLQRGSVVETDKSTIFDGPVYGNGGCFRVSEAIDRTNYMDFGNNNALYGVENGCRVVTRYGSLINNTGVGPGGIELENTCNTFVICSKSGFTYDANNPINSCGISWPNQSSMSNFYYKMGLDFTNYPPDESWTVVLNGMVLSNKCENCEVSERPVKINYELPCDNPVACTLCDTVSRSLTPTISGILGIKVPRFEVQDTDSLPKTGLNTAEDFETTGTFTPGGSLPGVYRIVYFDGDCYWSEVEVRIEECSCKEEFNPGKIDGGERSICSGDDVEITIGGNSASGGNREFEYEWRRKGIDGDEPIPDSNDSTYTIRPEDKINNGTEVIIYEFYRTARNSRGEIVTCQEVFVPSIDTFTLIVKPYSAAENIKVDDNSDKICDNDTVLLTASIDGMDDPVFVWYDCEKCETPLQEKTLAEGGDTLKVKVTNDTDKPVTITYWVSVSEDGKFCEDSVRKAVPVIVNPYFDADAITVTPDKTKYCNGDSVTLTATVDEAMATTNPTFVWYNCEKCETPLQEETLENGGNIFTAENLVEGDTIFYVAVYNDEFCEDTLRQAIPVIVNPYFDAGEIEVELDTTKYCGGDDAVLTAMVDEAMAATNPTFVWYNCEKCATPLQEETLENGGNIFTAENLAVGDTIFYVAVYNDEFCEDTVRQAKTITVNPYSDGEGLIDASGSDTVICAETTTTLRVTAKDVVNPVFRWYATVDETEPFKEEQAETSTWETPVLTKDTTFYVTVEGDNYCEGKDKRKAIPVKVNQLPTFKLEIDGGNNATCSETDVTVRINAEEEDGLTNYVWMRDGGKLIAGGQSDDSYITVQWLVENQDAIKTIKLSYTDKNGCRPADSASIDVEVYSKVPAPLLEEITCNVVPAGTADIIVLSPLSTPEVEFQYALRIESIHAASEYGEFQVSPVFKDIPNGLHFVKAKNMVNNCESDSTEIKFIHCDCPVPPEVLWENYDNWLVGDTTCGVDPIERDLKYFGTASMVFIGSNGDGALHYVVGNDTTVIVDENMPVGVGTENNVPFTVIYTPVASDAFKTVRIIAITDNPAGGKCEPDEAFWDIEVRPYSDTALIDVDGIDIPYCDNGEGVEAAIFASYRSEDIVDPTFVWYDENNVAVDTTKTGEAFTPILTVENDSATVYTFKVSVFGNNYCESSEGKTVQVQVNPYSESGKIVVPNNGDTICVWDELEEFEITATYDGSIKDPVFVWYDKAGADGKELATGSPFKPEINRPTVQTTYTYYVSVYGEDYCEDSVRQKVQITVNPYSESGNIVVPNNGDTICVWDESGAFEITATYKGSIKNPVFVWYDKAGADGRELAAGNPFKPEVDRPTVQTTYTYYVSVYGDNYCEDSVRQEVQITVNPYSESGNIAVPNNGDTICVWDELGAFEITATYEGSIKDPVFVWYDKAGADGEVLATGSPFKPEIDRPTVQTTYTYYVSVYGENYCEDSVRQKVQITVNPYSESGKIVVPNNGDTICVWDELGAFEITATYEGSIKKPVFVWYDKAGADGEVLATGNPFKPEVDRPTVQTTYTYYVSVYGDNYCEDSVRQEVQITVNPYSESGKIAVPNNGDTICVWDELEAFEITATYEGSINNPVFVWYDKAGADGKVLATGNPFKPEVERPTVQTTYTYYVSVYGDNYCEDNTRQKVQITINPYAPDLFITVSGNVICADNVAKLTAKAEGVIKPVFRWYVDSNTENEVDPEAVVFDERSSTFTTDILFNDTVFYVTVEGENYCENKARTPVNVRVNPLSEWDPNIFDSIIVCAGEIVDVPDFTGTHLDSTKVRWRQIDPYTNRPNFNVGLKDSVGTGNIPVFATKSDIVKQEEMWIIATPVSEFNCVNLKEIDTVKIIVNPLPYPPVTYTVNILLDSLPQSIEGGVDATSSYHTLYWYVDKDSAGSLKAPVQPIQDEYNDTISYTYWVRFQSLAGCWSDFESVTVNIWRAFVPVHTPNTAICQYESIYLDDLAKASEYHELLWYTDYDAPKGTGSLEVPVVNTEKTGVYHFYVSQKNKNTLAESDKATIQISVIGVNTPVLSPELQLGYCAYDTAQVLEMFVDTIGYSYFIVPDSVELSEEKYQRYVDTVRDSRIKVYRDTLVWYMNGEKLLSDPTINTSVDTTTNYSFQVEEWYFIAYNADTLQKYWKDIYASEYYFVESGLHICKADTSFNIHVEQKLELHPSAPVIREGSPLELTAHPANSSGFFKWYENEVFLDSTQNETFRIGEFFESAVYTVSNEYCVASANVEVEIFVPNIITPYNTNGKNDDFMIGSRSVVQVEIFNRYQQKVYEGNSGWDGTYRGRVAEPGTYYYRIQMKDGSVRKGTLEVANF